MGVKLKVRYFIKPTCYFIKFTTFWMKVHGRIQRERRGVIGLDKWLQVSLEILVRTPLPPLEERFIRLKRYQDPLTDFGSAYESILKKKVSEYVQEIPQ